MRRRSFLPFLPSYHLGCVSLKERQVRKDTGHALRKEAHTAIATQRSKQEQAAGRGAARHAARCSTMQPTSTPPSPIYPLPCSTAAEEILSILSGPAVLLMVACDLFLLHRDSSGFASSAEASGGQEGAKGSKKRGGVLVIGQVWPQQLLPL